VSSSSLQQDMVEQMSKNVVNNEVYLFIIHDLS
jgi:hypothetical protein